MNTTTTIGPPLVGPAMEVWGARLTGYLSAMGMVVLQYDCLLTLKDEIRLVWPGALSLPKVLYFLNRYLSFFAMIFCNYQTAGLRPPISTSFCQVWVLVSGTALPISTFSSTALLTLRVTALYRRVRWFTPLLWVAFVLFQGLRTAMMLLAAATLFRSLRYSPVSNICVPVDTSYRSVSLLLVPGIYDGILLGLTLIKGIKSAISLKGDAGSAIMFTLVRDELLYFFVISTLRIFNSIVWLVLSPSLIGVGIYAEWGLESTFTSRFFLNLRAIASHQPRTRFETLTRPSTFPAIRTRHTSNQPGLPTTYFCIETDVDKSIHTNETNPKKGGIQQAEIFDLEVLASQPHHGDGHDPASKNDVNEELSWR